MGRQLVLNFPRGDGRRMPAAVLSGRRWGCAVCQDVAEEAFGFRRGGTTMKMTTKRTWWWWWWEVPRGGRQIRGLVLN